MWVSKTGKFFCWFENLAGVSIYTFSIYTFFVFPKIILLRIPSPGHLFCVKHIFHIFGSSICFPASWVKRLKIKERNRINPFVPTAPFLYSLKASENLKVFWCFKGVEKGALGTDGLIFYDFLVFIENIIGRALTFRPALWELFLMWVWNHKYPGISTLLQILNAINLIFIRPLSILIKWLSWSYYLESFVLPQNLLKCMIWCLLDWCQSGPMKSVLLVIIGWVVMQFSQKSIFLIFCMKLGDYKGRKVTERAFWKKILEIFAKRSPN